METLPQFKIQQLLHEAMSAIVSYYLKSKLRDTSRIDSAGSSRAPSEAIATITPESQLSTEMPNDQELSKGDSCTYAPHSQLSRLTRRYSTGRSLDLHTAQSLSAFLREQFRLA